MLTAEHGGADKYPPERQLKNTSKQNGTPTAVLLWES